MFDPAPANLGPGFFQIPARDRYALRGVGLPATLTSGLPASSGADFIPADIFIDQGRVAAIAPLGSLDAGLGPDLAGSIVLPGFIDCHTHLDKGHIWPRTPNLTGDVPGAAAATTADRTRYWTAADVRARMEFGLRTAYAKGVVAIRTHLDSLAPQAAISFPVYRQVRDEWADRVDLQVSSIGPLDMFLRDEGKLLAEVVAESAGNLGCATRLVAHSGGPLPEAFFVALERVFDLATERGIGIDLHVDEATDPGARTLIEVARMAIRKQFRGPLLCGHCSSLALQPDEDIRRTIELCAEAGLAIVSLPTVNMYLQDRQPARTPRWRGVTVLHELRTAGVPVAIAGDNCRDPFYAYGDHDMLDTFVQGVKILHLDHPVGDWLRAATMTPASIMGLADRGRIEEGMSADLVVTRARNYSELLARHQYDRVVIRNGVQIDTRLPDYRELDDLYSEG